MDLAIFYLNAYVYSKEYGPPPGMESLDERRARMAREKEERERKLKEIEDKKNSKVEKNLN